MAIVKGMTNRLRLSQGSRHPPASPRRSRRNRQLADRHYSPTLRRRPRHHLAPPPPEITIAMIVGPASRRPIRALVDPRRAARQSNAALVCDAIWPRIFPSNTCVIGISPGSESPKSGATTRRTRGYPIRTYPNSAANNEPPNHFTTRGKPRPTGMPGMRVSGTRDPTRPNTPHSLGNARPASTTLTGRLEARPHNLRPT